MRYLFIDTETLGLDPKTHNLMEIALVLTDENFRTLESFWYPIKWKSYTLTTAALAVNGINFLEYEKTATPIEKVIEDTCGFLARLDGREAIPVGWNLGFDLGFIHAQLIDKVEWDRRVGYRNIDLCSVARFLKECGKLEFAGSLVRTAKGLGIDTEKAHTALGDVKITIEVMKKLKELI